MFFICYSQGAINAQFKDCIYGMFQLELPIHLTSVQINNCLEDEREQLKRAVLCTYVHLYNTSSSYRRTRISVFSLGIFACFSCVC